MRYCKLSIGWATLIFLPLVGLSIYAGQYLPVDMTARNLNTVRALEGLTAKVGQA